MLNQCHVGDCRQILSTLPRVQMCVTSPPYWGLRDYGTATWEGGDPECDHVGVRSTGSSTLKNDGRPRPGILENHKVPSIPYKEICGQCDAHRIDQQLGLERTPEEYVKNMAEVFRLVRDVLADDGTLWLNMGDSYSSGGRGTSDHHRQRIGENTANAQALGRKVAPEGLKDKDLVGIPWRLAFALQADGWYLRSDIIWHKPNPMPESVTDRPTKAHEYLFLLSKQERYYYDAEAIREDGVYGYSQKPGMYERLGINAKRTSYGNSVSGDGGNRNKRSVWTIPTQPYAEAHFATFPEALIEPCILAGSKSGDVVLDPFFGSGTVGEVCERLGRQWVGIELNSEYVALSETRTAQQGLSLG